MNKRLKTESGVGTTAAQRGMWSQMKFSKVQPWSDYGAMRVKRGTEQNVAMFGPTYKEASAEQRMNRKLAGYTGRGKYWGRALGQIAGGRFGAPGAIIGGELGDLASNMISRKFRGRGLYTGRGEYSKTNSNEMMAGSSNSSPVFKSVNDESGSLMVSHREYVGDIFAPPTASVSDFTIQSFPLNPGLEQTFPWLSQIAQNYEEYELGQCVFEFVSTVQDINSANGQVGTIITATQYNPSEEDFTDKPAMAAYAHSVSGKSTDNQNHGVECDPSKLSGSKGKYIRANPVMTGEDLKTYDHGRFQLATHNIPAAMASGTLGELYVVYTVKLRKPKFFTGRGLGLTRFLAVADETQAGGNSITFPFGTDNGTLVARQNNLAVAVARTTNTVVLTFPAYYGGRLRVSFIVEGTAITTGGADFINTTSVAGNVSHVSDMYAAGNAGTGDSPTFQTRCGSDLRQILIASINVEPATNATDNTYTLVTDITGGTINQSSIEVTEHNTFGSAGAAALVNSAGTAVTL